ncbi:hypothetical protein GW17_00026025 [Ensete ventricosum]|nr:hypothetical protein GW17_00026025 [Ensete ventricosum]RZS04075.1 hypothetical protein BHM03_00034352 [Ensete ventricosum]
MRALRQWMQFLRNSMTNDLCSNCYRDLYPIELPKILALSVTEMEAKVEIWKVVVGAATMATEGRALRPTWEGKILPMEERV